MLAGLDAVAKKTKRRNTDINVSNLLPATQKRASWNLMDS
jgi:hypothetical protein